MKNKRSEDFNIIYRLAKQNKREKLEEYLANPNIAIDCKDGLFTVAGRLAMEGYIDASELLRELGANVDDIAYGAAYGSQRGYIDDLINDRQPDSDFIVRGAAAGLHLDLIDDLQDEFRDSEYFHVEDESIADGLHDSGLFKDPETALFTFATAEPYLYLSKDINSYFSFDLKAIQKQGHHLASLIYKYDLNFHQALAWQKDAVKIWLFQAKNISALTHDMMTNIATYLSPITLKDATDLLKKTSFKYNQQFMSEDLKAYHRVIPHLFFKNPTDAVERLLKCVEASKNIGELRNALQSAPVENQVLDSILDKYTKRLCF